MSTNVETLTGYIVRVAAPKKSKNIPVIDEVVEVVENKDEIDEDDVMEMDEISAVIEGAFQSHSRPVARKTVNFRYKGGEMSIAGPFLFTDIWWEIEVDVLMSTKNVQHTPRYRIKPEWGREDIDQYLMACQVPPDKHSETFTLIKKILRKQMFSVNEILELTFLEEKIIDGGAQFSCEEGNLYKMVQPYLVKSPITALIRRAASFPHLFWKLQAILPTRAYGILTNNTTEPKTMITQNNKRSLSGSPDLAGLNKALDETPWEFAFSGVLYKKYNLSGSEAKLSDLKKSGVFDDLNDVMKDNIIVYNNLKNYCSRWGHTYINCPGKKKSDYLVKRHCIDRSQTQMFLCSDRIGAARCEPRSVHSDMPRLFLSRFWQAERNIAENLQTIMGKGAQNCTEFCLPDLEGKDRKDLDDNQIKAVHFIRTKPLTVLSGMGGCGKTTVVSRLVRRYCNFHMVSGNTKPNQACLESGDHCILLTAPTGKAASSLGKKCGLPACTLHSVIYSHMAWKTSQSHQVNYAAHGISKPHEEKSWKFANTKMLVVDECSMVAVTTFNKLLKILLEETSLGLCKVVLVGDFRQLPSIEPGNFFEDVFRVAGEYGFGVDLKRNYRVDAGGRSIAKNAEKISKGKMPKFDEETFGLPKNDDSRFLFLEVQLEEADANDGRTEGRAREATIDKLEELLKSKSTGIEDVTTSQIITFTRNLVTHANNVCAQHYNNRNDKDKKENSKLDFREKDKICCRKNCQMENPFYGPKVGDSNTGAGFSDGNFLNRAKKDNVLSSEEALKLLNGKQETIMTADDSMLSSNSGSQFATPMLQQEENREKTEGEIDQDENVGVTEEGELKNHKIDRTEQVLDEVKPMWLTNDNTYGNEGLCENKDMNANERNRTLEKNRNLDNSDPGVSQDERKTRAQGDVPQSAEIENENENECEVTNNEKSFRVFNGDTFFIKKLKDIWDDGTSSCKPAALLDDMESNKMWVDLSAFRRTGKAEHAWCRTIHTFQGSEVKTVIYLISSNKRESWRHVYTAVTRGKEKVIVIGPKKYLLEALMTNYKRDTGLEGFFQKELEKRQGEQRNAIGGSREDVSVSAKLDTDMDVPIFPGGGLKRTEVNAYDDSHLHDRESICTEKGDDVDDKDNLPSVFHQSEFASRQLSQNDKKQTTGTKFTEPTESQHRLVSSVEGSPPSPPPPLPSPPRSPIQEALQKRKIPQERPMQEVKHVKTNRSHQTTLTDFYEIHKRV